MVPRPLLSSSCRGTLHDVGTKSKTPRGRDGDEFTSVRIDRVRLERLRKMAEREDRSIAAVVRRIIDRELDAEAQEAA